MQKYEIVVYENYHTIDTEEKFYKEFLKFFIFIYKRNFIKTIRAYKNFKQFLYDKYPQLQNHKLAEFCYWFYNDLNDFPKCDNKKCQNKVTHFRSFLEGYSRGAIKEHYCCQKCAYHSDITTQRRHKTCKSIYGVENPNQFNSKNIKYRKYKQIKVYNRFLNEEVIPLFSLEEYLIKNATNTNRIELWWKCTKCNSIFKAKISYCSNRINGQIHHVRCLKCYPLYNFSGKTTSNKEKDVVAFIKSIYFGKIVENDRTLMVPDKKYNSWKLNHELDIVLPSIKLAIEFNGIYWHNSKIFPETVIDDNEKLRQCNKLGIKLIYINEKDWINNKEDVQKLLLEIIKNRTKFN